jgi:hypothetical protein
MSIIVAVAIVGPGQQAATGPPRTKEDVLHRSAYDSIAFGVVAALPPVAIVMVIGGGGGDGLSMTHSTGDSPARAPYRHDDDDKDDGIRLDDLVRR